MFTRATPEDPTWKAGSMLAQLMTDGPRRAGDEARSLAYLTRSGVVAPQLPHRLLPGSLSYWRYGALGWAVTAAAARYGDRVAVMDERGWVSFRDLERRSNAVANGWRARGLRGGNTVGVLARNHRGFLDALFGAAKCGARIVLLNTDFSAPQLRDVCEREGVDLLVLDEQYLPLAEGIAPRHGIWRAWAETPGDDTLDFLISSAPASPPARPGRIPRLVLLTSGTTGTPKGAARREARSLTVMGGMLGRVPFRTRDVIEVSAPLFHGLGAAVALFGIAMGSTLVLRRRFDPAATLAGLATHRATALVVVPVMLRRMLDLGPEARGQLDLSALRIVMVGGSQLGSGLCAQAMDAFGPIVYNVYGSTEVALATIATPTDLAAAPDCVGGVTCGAVVRILDGDGRPVSDGESGRIFVGNAAQFSGYTGGGSKQVIRGLMSTGDLGHFDADGRLFIDGRDDEMIVSGGENVFPKEVEEALSSHRDIMEAAVVGVPDDAFGHRLRAFVVVRDGHELSADDVRGHVRGTLARYKVPRDVVFLDELPRTPTGKVLKRLLPEPAAPPLS